MTAEEAIGWLRKYRRDIPRFNYTYGALHQNKEFLYQSFEQYIVQELIEAMKIINSRSDPIDIVFRLYCDLDHVLSHSDDDHRITHNCASMMENITRDILRYLREKEIQKNDESFGTGKVDISKKRT